MRGLFVIALALLLAGAASAGSARSTSGSPLSLGSLSEASGAAATTIGGQRLRFLPNARFSVGLVLRNTSHAPVVVSGADVAEPPRTLIHQVGARFHPFRNATCPAGASCPAPTFPIGSGKNMHPHPFTVPPGKSVGVELDFRLGSCAEVPGASSAPISRLRVAFREAGASVRRHTFALGYDAFRLRMPKPEDCMFPRSRLWVNDPSHIGTSYYFTILGSKGDICMHTAGGLAFRSRAYLNNDRRRERIQILVAGFSGTGTYRHAIARVVVGKRIMFHSEAVVTVTKATRHEVFARVRADKLRPQAAPARYRIYGWMRCRIGS